MSISLFILLTLDLALVAVEVKRDIAFQRKLEKMAMEVRERG